MNRIFIGILLIFVPLLTSVRAEDIYIYKEKRGNIVITNRPIPENYKAKAQKVNSFKYEAPSGKRPTEGVQAVQSTKTYDPKSYFKKQHQMEKEAVKLFR